MQNDPRQILKDAAEDRGKPLKDLSLGAGKNHAYLQQFVTRGVPRKLPEDVRAYLATALDIAEVDLGGPDRASVLTSPPSLTPYPRVPPNASPPVPVSFPNATIGMYGSGVAGEDGKFVLNGQRIMDVLCPPSLIGVRDAYGVFVHGNSMKPRYHEGEGVFANPHLPVRQEDYAIVQMAGEFEGDDVGGFVKQFISQNSRELVLAQYQPPVTFPEEPFSDGRFLIRFPRSKVVAVHRIVWAGEV